MLLLLFGVVTSTFASQARGPRFESWAGWNDLGEVPSLHFAPVLPEETGDLDENRLADRVLGTKC